MEELSPREKKVLAEVASFAKRFGRWGTVREISSAIADKEGLHKDFSVGSTFRVLAAKGVLAREGRQYSISGYTVKVRRAALVKLRASRDALSGT